MKFVVKDLPSKYSECNLCSNNDTDYPVCKDTERLEVINGELCYTYQLCMMYTYGKCDKLISLSNLL